MNPQRNRGWWLTIAVGLVFVPAAAVHGQAPLTLETVVRATLEGNARIQLERQQVEIAGAELLSAQGRFSTRLGTTLAGGQEKWITVGTNGKLDLPGVQLNRASYVLGLSKQLRSGLLLQPEISVSRSDLSEWEGPTSRANVSFTVLAPLLRDRGGSITRAQERSAQTGYQADVLSLRHTTSVGLLDAISAYWNYLAALERLAVYAFSEARAERLAEDTRVLVEAEERPASDLNQLLANISSKRIARISAEQGVVEARQRLGLAMGLAGASIAALPAAVDGLPERRPFSADSATLEQLTEIALARRADIAAAARQQEGVRILLDATRKELNPKLDLSITVGYNGVETGPPENFFARGSLEQYFTPLYRNNSAGPNTSIQINFQPAFSNADARGRALQRQAILEQQRISARELVRRVISGVTVSAEALQRNGMSLADAEESVDLYRKTVENEKTKFQLGVVTLFDVVLAEDGLTSALLGVVNSRLGYALSLAELRYETGTLFAGEDSEAFVTLVDLVTPP